MSASFCVGALPRVDFGEGAIARLAPRVAACGRRALLVTGAASFDVSPGGRVIRDRLTASVAAWVHVRVDGEPTASWVDATVGAARPAGFDVVVAVGGGSVLDAGKAVAALLPSGRSVLDHIEVVGRGLPFEGPSLPCIAVPTTAGTGSEATRNAVLGTGGADRTKRSFRHDELVPRWAVVDPDLLSTCPPDCVAGSGLDAVTQLIESLTSLNAQPFAEALAWSGLAAARDGLLALHADAASNAAGRRCMAWAALASGFALAATGLGAVHGLSSPLGGRTTAPHGMLCATLLAAVTRANLRALETREPSHPALATYARIGALLSGRAPRSGPADRAALVEVLDRWTAALRVPRLAAWGVAAGDLDPIVRDARRGSMRTNPIVLTDRELVEVLESRL